MKDLTHSIVEGRRFEATQSSAAGLFAGRAADILKRDVPVIAHWNDGTSCELCAMMPRAAGPAEANTEQALEQAYAEVMGTEPKWAPRQPEPEEDLDDGYYEGEREWMTVQAEQHGWPMPN